MLVGTRYVYEHYSKTLSSTRNLKARVQELPLAVAITRTPMTAYISRCPRKPSHRFKTAWMHTAWMVVSVMEQHRDSTGTSHSSSVTSL